MSVSYTAIGWNRQKRVYDATAAAAIVGFLSVFVLANMLVFAPPHDVSPPVILIRALGACAIVLLHIILAIGPLCRLNRRFLPLLYNRRHLGVMMFLIALAHGLLATLWYHAFGNKNPALSLLSSNVRFDSLREFPFEIPGILALVWLALMAATSHDFWLKNLSPRVWKNLHMGVYVAYGLVVAHVALGLLQAEHSPVFSFLIGAGVIGLSGLHIAAGAREKKRDTVRRAAVAAEPSFTSARADGWIDVCAVTDIPDTRAVTLCIAAGQGDGRPERIAIFRAGDRFCAVANVCRHQGGPLGEGKIVDGCITCPWHGYQYQPENGTAPAPFDDKVPTYRVRITRDRIEVDPTPFAPGTPLTPARLADQAAAGDQP